MTAPLRIVPSPANDETSANEAELRRLIMARDNLAAVLTEVDEEIARHARTWANLRRITVRPRIEQLRMELGLR